MKTVLLCDITVTSPIHGTWIDRMLFFWFIDSHAENLFFKNKAEGNPVERRYDCHSDRRVREMTNDSTGLRLICLYCTFLLFFPLSLLPPVLSLLNSIFTSSIYPVFLPLLFPPSSFKLSFVPVYQDCFNNRMLQQNRSWYVNPTFIQCIKKKKKSFFVRVRINLHGEICLWKGERNTRRGIFGEKINNLP